MKNKIFAIIMTAVMLFGMTAYAENEYTFDEEFCKEYKVKNMPVFTDVSKLSKEFDLLVRLNIISGYEDGTLKPDRTMTRAEAAKMLCYIINANGMIEQYEENYTKEGFERQKSIYAENGDEEEFTKQYEHYINAFLDVKVENWYFPYICSALDNSYIIGYEDNTFRPENKVSEIEFLCMLERALGYFDMIEAEGGYPEGVIAISNRLKLIDNPSNAPTTRERAATMLYNALHSNIITIEGFSIGENGHIEKKYANSMTLLEHKDIFKVRGTLKMSSVISEKTVALVSDTDYYNKYAGVELALRGGEEYIFPKEYSDIGEGEYDVYIDCTDSEHPVIAAVEK